MTQAKHRTRFRNRWAAICTGFWLALLLMLSGPVTAAGTNLYTIQVPVDGSSPAQLQQGYRNGLEAVILRVSGSRAVFDNPGIEAILEDPESLLQSYQFLRGDANTTDQLRMTFGSVGVTRALADIGASVWGANRPLTLAWVAVEEQGSRALVTSAGSGPWADAFRNAAADRGLPLMFPSQEAASDRRMLSEVWGQFMDSIRGASDVDHDFLSAIRISGGSGGWQAAWALEGAGVDESGSSQAATPNELARAIINTWADRMATRYAVSGGDLADATRVQVVIDGIHSVTDFGRVRQAVTGMDPVTSFGIAAVQGDRLVLRLGFSGELEQLREYIALDERFQLATDPVPLQSPERPQNNASVTDESEVAQEAGSNAEGESAAENQSRPEQATAESAPAPDRVAASSNASPAVSTASFASLYETLYYRWRGGSPVAEPETEGGGASEAPLASGQGAN